MVGWLNLLRVICLTACLSTKLLICVLLLIFNCLSITTWLNATYECANCNRKFLVVFALTTGLTSFAVSVVTFPLYANKVTTSFPLFFLFFLTLLSHPFLPNREH